MPGSIQSIERAAAVLRLIGAADEPLGLAEVSTALALPKPTVHGILRTLLSVGFVDRAEGSSRWGRYVLGEGLQRMGAVRIDAQELRSQSMNWADELAARTRMSVRVGVLTGGEVLVAHHVFRPDGSPQRLCTGQRLPAHATALGKALLARAPAASYPQAGAPWPAYTKRTVTSPPQLAAALAAVRREGYATEAGEHVPDQGSIAAPVHGPGGFVVGAVAVVAPLDEVLVGSRYRPRRDVLDGTRHAATQISRAVDDLWAPRP